MTEEPEVLGTWAVGGIEEAKVGPISTKWLLRILDVFTVSGGFEAFVDVANGGMLVLRYYYIFYRFADIQHCYGV